MVKERETKSTRQIAEELGRDYDAVLRFVHEVHEMATRYARKISLEGVVEVDIYPCGGER